MKKTWYARSGSKTAELWTLLHIPYTFMCLSFLLIGFGIQKPIDWYAAGLFCLIYFLGLGIAAHAFDQLPGMGSSYVEHLTKKELLFMGIVSITAAWALIIYFAIIWKAWLMIPLMVLQSFFAVSYPIATTFKGIFHNDFWFSVSFGLLPVAVGFYANSMTISATIVPFALVCFLIASVQITLSRYARKLRKESFSGIGSIASGSSDGAYIEKPERSLKLLCILAYLLAIAILLL